MKSVTVCDKGVTPKLLHYKIQAYIYVTSVTFLMCAIVIKYTMEEVIVTHLSHIIPSHNLPRIYHNEISSDDYENCNEISQV